MDELSIEGKRPLQGEITPAGSKNAALPILAASLLASEPIELARLPRVGDVRRLLHILRRLGTSVQTYEGTVRLLPAARLANRPPERTISRLRAGFLVLAPLLARTGRARIALPGGCRIGERPVDIHLRGLAQMGAEFHFEGDQLVGRCRRLRGTRLDAAGPRGPSVTGTAQLLLAAVLARGTSLIENAAQEPEVTELATFLVALGARIEGVGGSRMVVRGVDSLGGCAWRLPVDRIETLSYLLAGAATGGNVLVREAPAAELAPLLESITAAGAAVECSAAGVRVVGTERPRAVNYCAAPYPGIPTDGQPLWTAWMATARGASAIEDPVFPDRWTHLAPLRRMGAKIAQQAAACRVRGVPRLRGARLRAPDLRCGAALVLAALAAKGESRIRGLQHLDRGYEDMEEKLLSLGARIERRKAREHRCESPEMGEPILSSETV